VIAEILVKQRDALAETLNTAPLALNNLFLTYNPETGTLDTRANVGENLAAIGNDPSALLCSILDQADASKKACGLVKQVFKGLPRAAALEGPDPTSRQGTQPGAGPVEVEHIDRSLAGLVEVD
jgi:phospholipid/cholesterol/gamma-HCH transport system substrate-binding protein